MKNEEVIDFFKKALIEELNNPEENIKEKKRNERKKLKTELQHIEYMASLPPITKNQFLKRFEILVQRYKNFINQTKVECIFIPKKIDFQQIFHCMRIAKNGREFHAIIDTAEKEMNDLENILKIVKKSTNEIITQLTKDNTK